jgi:hypothetical protein
MLLPSASAFSTRSADMPGSSSLGINLLSAQITPPASAVAARPLPVNIRIWDLPHAPHPALYAHALHSSKRCIYVYVWKPITKQESSPSSGCQDIVKDIVAWLELLQCQEPGAVACTSNLLVLLHSCQNRLMRTCFTFLADARVVIVAALNASRGGPLSLGRDFTALSREVSFQSSVRLFQNVNCIFSNVLNPAARWNQKSRLRWQESTESLCISSFHSHIPSEQLIIPFPDKSIAIFTSSCRASAKRMQHILAAPFAKKARSKLRLGLRGVCSSTPAYCIVPNYFSREFVGHSIRCSVDVSRSGAKGGLDSFLSMLWQFCMQLPSMVPQKL